MAAREIKGRPGYRLHKASGQAIWVLTWAEDDRRGRRVFYLGSHRSPESFERYDQLRSAWLAAGRPRPWFGPGVAGAGQDEALVAQVVTGFIAHLDAQHERHGQPTRKHIDHHVRPALVHLDPYLDTPAAEFGPLQLRAVRNSMVESGMVRRSINSRVQTIIRACGWAVSEQLIPASIPAALRSLPPLKQGRTEAPDHDPVEPASMKDVEETLKHLSRQLQAMVLVQLHTGMRPGEVVGMRRDGIDIPSDGGVWIYTPCEHKTSYLGIERQILLGPKAQEALRPFIRLDPGYLFSPARTVAEQREKQSQEAAARWKGDPDKRPRSKNRKAPSRLKAKHRKPGDCYKVASYSRAVKKACALAGVDAWSPNRLRHTAASRIASAHGIEVARLLLGHASGSTTAIYAERDLKSLAKVVMKVG